MLKVSKQQLDYLSALKTVKFYKKIKAYLLTYYEKELRLLGAEKDQLKWIEKVVKKAKGYGMDTESELYTYARAAITFGENFHELPWAKDILQLKLMSSSKARFLQDAMMAELEKMTAKAEQNRDRLLNKKAMLYSSEKADYVFSFNLFYGLGLNSIEDAKKWLTNVAITAMTFGFTDDFLLDSYLEVALYFGKDFHTENWANNMLTSDKLITDKLSYLLGYLSDNFGQQDDK